MNAGEPMVTCADLLDAVPDLIVNAVPEPRRATLLAHAHSCVRCSTELADAVKVSDALLDVAPTVEPPDGFETRAAARMGGHPRQIAPRWWSRRALVTAAAAVVAVVMMSVASMAALERRSDHATTRVTAPVVSEAGDDLGSVDLERLDGASRIVITMSDVDWDGTWTCQLQAPDGAWVDIGTWTADDVTGGVWAAGVPDGLAGATKMRILGSSGSVIAGATFSAR